MKTELNSGSLYFLKLDHHIKIGHTKDLISRLPSIVTASAHPVEVINAIWFHDIKLASDAERWLHDYYRDERRNGEWFELNAEQEDFVRNLTALMVLLIFEWLTISPEQDEADHDRAILSVFKKIAKHFELTPRRFRGPFRCSTSGTLDKAA